MRCWPRGEQWPADGVPARPGAWLWTVARRRAVDVLRRDLRYRDQLLAARGGAGPPPAAAAPDGGERPARLIFTCCHPALAPRRRWR